MLEGEEDLFVGWIEQEGRAAEEATDDGCCQGQVELAEMAAESPRQGGREPLPGGEAVRPFPGFVDLAEAPRHQRFQIRAELRGRSKAVDVGQGRRSSLVQV